MNDRTGQQTTELSTLIRYWKRMTAQAVCSSSNCETCHEVYGNSDCPVDIDIMDNDKREFVKRVLNRLNEISCNEVFDFEMTDDEFISILNDCIPE